MNKLVRITATPSLASLYKNIWYFASGTRLMMLASTFLLISSTVVKLALPWIAAQAINELQRGTHESVRKAALWVLATLVVYIIAWLFHGPGRILERNVGVKVRQRVSDALYTKLTHAPLAWHERQHSGDVQNRISQASHGLYNFAQNQFIYLQSAVNFVAQLLLLFYYLF